MKTFCLFFSVLFLTSCPTDLDFETTCNVDIHLENLTWLKEIKNSFEQSSSITKNEIVKYEYNNETVFLIDSCKDCADNLIVVYNCEGIVICEFGGIAGLNTCPDFETNAIKIAVLWEN